MPFPVPEMVVGVLSNKISKDVLKSGDHIYSWRNAYLYAHHGIYVGDGMVIHFTRGAGQEIGTGTVLDRLIFSSSPSRPSDSPCPRCCDQSSAEGVVSSCLECFLYGGELYLFQYGVSPALFIAKTRGGTCTLAPSDPPEHVLHRAEFLLQNGFGVYNIFKNNCEDFAIYCKTGLLVFTNVSVGRSGQATSILAATTAIVSSPLRFLTTSVSGLAAVGYGVYCVSRFVSDIGVRRDVTKIPVERLVVCPGSQESECVSESLTTDKIPVERLVVCPGSQEYHPGSQESESVSESSTTDKIPLERLVVCPGSQESEFVSESSTTDTSKEKKP